MRVQWNVNKILKPEHVLLYFITVFDVDSKPRSHLLAPPVVKDLASLL